NMRRKVAYYLISRLRMTFNCNLIGHSSGGAKQGCFHFKHIGCYGFQVVNGRIFFKNIIAYRSLKHGIQHLFSRFCNGIRHIINMKKFLLAILMISSVSSLFAQNKYGSISGSVIDGSRKTIESATIALCKVKDSAVVKYSVADKDGKFLFENIKEGEYFVSVT